MIFSNLARHYGGVAYREQADERGDAGPGAEGGDDEATNAAETERLAEEQRLADKAAREKDIAIPKARHDEAVGRERKRAEAAEKELAKHRETESQRKARLDVKKVNDEISELEDQLERANAEGTPESRKAIRGQIRDKERALARAEAKEESSMATALAVEQVTYNGAVERAEADYPFLVPNTDAFNLDLATEVMELKAGFEGAGHSSSESLKRALKYLKPQLDAAKKAQGEGDEVGEAAAVAEAKRKADEKAAAGGDAAAKAEAKRKAEAAQKGQAAAKGQPAAAAGAAGQADKSQKGVDPTKMSDKEFDKLSDEEKARLRGDFA